MEQTMKVSCELSEIKSKHFLKEFHKFTNHGFRVLITWKTRNEKYFLESEKLFLYTVKMSFSF